jgi:glucose/mannose-6-phosphate isomerase
MYQLLKAFPDHWAEGTALGASLDTTLDAAEISNLVVAGMGGSAIGGDLLRTYGLDRSPLPVYICRSYSLPAFVSADSLVIVSSYSGNTEETLACLREALERNCKVVCITSGGQVLQAAREHSLPYVIIPGGMPPRAALGYSFSVLLQIASRIKLCTLDDAELVATQRLLREGVTTYSDYSENAENEALEIAQRIAYSVPVIYSESGFLEGVNLRWRGQLQENAKVFAVGNFYPEMNHNEIMGWEHIAHLTGRASLILLEDEDDHPRVRQHRQVRRHAQRREAQRPPQRGGQVPG